MEDQQQVEQERQRAEMFDALGHPTRIQILKVLSEGSLGFADLKKRTGIDSSGHLHHHLTKLDGLIKTDEYGRYCLSDEGKDALITVQTVEDASPKREAKEKEHRHFKVGLKPVAIVLLALLIASSAIAIYEYNQASNLQKEAASFNGNYAATAYFNEFGVFPNTHVNASFTPPISMYQALMIGLNADGYNKTSLQGWTIDVYLMPWETGNSTGSNMVGGDMTTTPRNYSDITTDGVTYQYVWQIVISKGGLIGGVHPWNLIMIDASTGQIVPNPLFY